MTLEELIEEHYEQLNENDLYIWQTIFYKGIMPSETGFRFSSGL